MFLVIYRIDLNLTYSII